jgi:hypothetical protein
MLLTEHFNQWNTSVSTKPWLSQQRPWKRYGNKIWHWKARKHVTFKELAILVSKQGTHTSNWLLVFIILHHHLHLVQNVRIIKEQTALVDNYIREIKCVWKQSFLYPPKAYNIILNNVHCLRYIWCTRYYGSWVYFHPPVIDWQICYLFFLFVFNINGNGHDTVWNLWIQG